MSDGKSIKQVWIAVGFVVLTCPAVVRAALSAAGVTSQSVTLNWTAVGDDGGTGIATYYDIRYSQAPITDANWSSATQVVGEPTPQAAGSPESFTVTGLSPATTYYFAIRVGDEIPNWSALSNVVQKTTTQESIPPANVADLAVTMSSATSLSISWTSPGDDSTTGTASQYDIRYSLSPITEVNWAGATAVSGAPAPATAGTVQSLVISGLSPSTAYYIAMKTADEVPNWSGLSNVASGTTSNESTAPAAIANLDAAGETETTITLSWTAPGDDGNTGTATTYDIRYSVNPITGSNWNQATQVTGEPSPKQAGSAESFVVSGLSSNTLYYFAVKTADEVPNWSTLSNVVSRSTAQDQTPPNAINDLQAATGTSDGQILLGWSAPPDGLSNARVAGYEIRYSSGVITDVNWSNAALFGSSPPPVDPGKPQRFEVTGLVPGQFYYLAVKSFDSASNFSPISNAASAIAGFKLITDVSDSAASLVTPAEGAVVPTARPILVAGGSASGSASGYYFEIARDSSFISIVTSGLAASDEAGNVKWKVEQPLQPGEVYFWRVHSGSNVYSALRTFTVAPVAHVYPNPFYPASSRSVTFTDIQAGSDLQIISVGGEIIREWTSVATGELLWDGTNEQGRQVASGVYLWFADRGSRKGKLVVVR